ncbi:MAG TPA: YdeI/OmpD-associated family protein [Bacteroidales bacterium]|nr:YdeI/OmpD-associated family protein [Bacteroidales bacterium]
MTENKKIEFTAHIIQHQGMDAAFVEIPFDVKEFFGRSSKLKVKALFDGKVLYRGSLFHMGQETYVIGLTKDIRKRIDKTFGEMVQVEMEEDKEDRTVSLPEDVSCLLADNAEAGAYFNSLSFTNRKEYICWIESAKRQETRINRLKTFMEKLNSRKKLTDR